MDSQRTEKIQLTKISGDVVTSVGGLSKYFDSDWFLSVHLTKSIDFTDYVNISKDSYKFSIDRQNINPYFFELGFFETIDGIGYNSNNVDYWANITKQLDAFEGPILYNTLFDVMNNSLELKSAVFNIQIQPDPVSSESITVIIDKMNEIKSITESNQIAFVETTLNK